MAAPVIQGREPAHLDAAIERLRTAYASGLVAGEDIWDQVLVRPAQRAALRATALDQESAAKSATELRPLVAADMREKLINLAPAERRVEIAKLRETLADLDTVAPVTRAVQIGAAEAQRRGQEFTESLRPVVQGTMRREAQTAANQAATTGALADVTAGNVSTASALLQEQFDKEDKERTERIEDPYQLQQWYRDTLKQNGVLFHPTDSLSRLHSLFEKERKRQYTETVELEKVKADLRRRAEGARVPTEHEANAHVFSTMMQMAEDILADPASGLDRDAQRFVAAAKVVLPQWAWTTIDGKLPVREAAKRMWISGHLRDVSGAAIQDPEYDRANREFFPLGGDTPEALANKAEARARRLKATINEATGIAGGPVGPQGADKTRSGVPQKTLPTRLSNLPPGVRLFEGPDGTRVYGYVGADGLFHRVDE
jgi:hypothetical protein